MRSDDDREYTIEELRSMTDDERMQIVFRKSEALRRRIAEQFRMEHPGCAEWEVKLELLRHAFAPEPVPAGVEEWLRKYDGPRWA